MLLVRGEVDHQIGGGDQLLVVADREAVAGGVLPGLAFLGDGRIPQGIGDIKAGVAQVEPLVQPLGAAADDDDLLAFEVVDAVSNSEASMKRHLPSSSSCRRSGRVLK